MLYKQVEGVVSSLLNYSISIIHSSSATAYSCSRLHESKVQPGNILHIQYYIIQILFLYCILVAFFVLFQISLHFQPAYNKTVLLRPQNNSDKVFLVLDWFNSKYARTLTNQTCKIKGYQQLFNLHHKMQSCLYNLIVQQMFVKK